MGVLSSIKSVLVSVREARRLTALGRNQQALSILKNQVFVVEEMEDQIKEVKKQLIESIKMIENG